MKKYMEPQMNVLTLSEEDILTVSITSATDCGYTPWDEIFLDV